MAEAEDYLYPIARETTVGVRNLGDYLGMHFDAEGYSRFLGSIGFKGTDIEAVSVSFQLISPLLEIDSRRGSSRLGIIRGGYSEEKSGTHNISIYVGDNAKYAAAYGLNSIECLNEALGHETGHLYDNVVLGNSSNTLYKRMLRGIYATGGALWNVPRTMVHRQTVQELLPLYADRPLLMGAIALGSAGLGATLSESAWRLKMRRYRNAPEEAFANAFREGFMMPGFISAVDRQSR